MNYLKQNSRAEGTRAWHRTCKAIRTSAGLPAPLSSPLFSLLACLIFPPLKTGFFHLSGACGKSWLPHGSHIGLCVKAPASFSLAAVFQCQLQTPRRTNLAQLGPKVRHSGLRHRRLCPTKAGHRAYLGTPPGKVRKGDTSQRRNVTMIQADSPRSYCED